jgi:lipoyl(octanoyl) transferase
LNEVDWSWLGRVGWAATARLQEQLRSDLLQGSGRETVLLCEHDPVITLGRRAQPGHLLLAADELRRRGVEIARASRGGEVTYHGPGQLVAYPVIRVRRGVVAHVEAMARGVIALLAELGIEAHWRRETPGVWVNGAKLCAFGIHVRHRVAIHGLALNVHTDLRAFEAIVPCGLPGVAVTSIERIARREPGVGETSGLRDSPSALAPRLARHLARAFALEPREVEARMLPAVPDCQMENGIDNMILA